jgi:hypothetical protein
MKRSAKVTAPLLASLALSMTTGCRKPEMQRCVDETNKVVDDKLCASQPLAGDSQQQRSDGHGGFLPYPAEGHSYINSTGVRTGTVRGGFGRSMSSGSHSSGGAGE